MVCLAGGVAAGVALPEESTAGLTVETIAESRIQDAGGKQYAPAERLHIGEEIYYTLRVRNDSGSAASDAVVIRALPRNTRYVAASATGPAAIVSYSINGGATFASAEQLTILASDGSTRAANANDYTHIRWQLRHSLAPGATALLRFRGVFR